MTPRVRAARPKRELTAEARKGALLRKVRSPGRTVFAGAVAIGRELVLLVGDLLQMALIAAVLALALVGAHIFADAQPLPDRAPPAREVRL